MGKDIQGVFITADCSGQIIFWRRNGLTIHRLRGLPHLAKRCGRTNLTRQVTTSRLQVHFRSFPLFRSDVQNRCGKVFEPTCPQISAQNLKEIADKIRPEPLSFRIHRLPPAIEPLKCQARTPPISLQHTMLSVQIRTKRIGS